MPPCKDVSVWRRTLSTWPHGLMPRPSLVDESTTGHQHDQSKVQ
jgi:hypothetical protein